MIECISFDLWGTLITSNPAYKVARLDIVSQYVDKSQFSRADIQHAFNSVKADFDVLTEKYGVQFNSVDLYNSVFDLLGITNSIGLRSGIIEALRIRFIETPPIVIDGTIEVISRLACNYAIVLVSNTLLIDGHILHESLKPSGLWRDFDSIIFSSEEACAKPSRLIFERAYNSVLASANQVVHVGDNVRTDGFGIERVGGTFFHINGTSGKTIKHVEMEYGN